MLSEPCILLYGNDDYLLETRQLVLERVGFIRTVSSFLALHEIISTRNIDILILCHSLSREECEHALAVAHVHAPGNQDGGAYLMRRYLRTWGWARRRSPVPATDPRSWWKQFGS